MKQTMHHSAFRHHDTNYFTAKALEILTAVASGLCCVAGMIFLVILA